jgi:glycosyltransferase involved in cell wall biosynthesis
MKIVFLADDFPPTSFGGAGISTFELAEGVKKAGHDVFVITTGRNKSEAGESDYQGLKVFKIASSYHERWRAWVSIYNPPVVRQVEELLEKIRPDVVHANNVHCYLSYYCLKVAKRYAGRVVWTARDTMAFSYGKLNTPRYLEALDARLSWRDNVKQAGKRYNPFRNFFIKKYMNYADKKFDVSDALRRALAQNGIGGVEVIHTGIDVDAWQTSSDTLASFRKKFGLENKKVILFGGRLGAGAQAVLAMKLVTERQDTTLLVMGKEESAGRMKSGSSGLSVIFTGWLSDKERIAAYYASDIVWVPSTYFDAFPRSALEASASGKPVIVSKFGGAPELVQDGVTGYVVNPFNLQEIADKTLDLLRHPEKALSFGKAGQQRVQKEFNIRDKIQQLISQYQAPFIPK